MNPVVGYMNDVAKSGSKLAAKEFLQTSLKDGLEQGAKNLDSFKGLVKHVGQFGDNVLKNIDHYAKQVGNLTKGKVASVADNLASQLRHADDTLSKAAQNFSLNNIGFEPQLVSGAIPIPPPGRLSGLADNIQAFAKNLDGSVDEVVEAGAKSGDDVPRLKEIEVKFKQSQKHDEIEFTRQLTDQEAGMNQLTVQEYLDNRERYIAEGRAIEGNAAQQAARKKALADKVIEFREMGLSRSEAKIRAQEWLDTQAALHNPDQIAGGFADRIGGMGDTRINSSIGSQWRYRIDIVDDQIKRMASEMTPDQLRSTYLNVKLTY
ncbi:TPA: hypothetical protein U2B91_002246 [Streptococcus suis]|nr:hypothetical protein [Streptococcus suis]